MPWLELRIDSSREAAEPAEEALLNAGALSVTLQDNADQPIFEPALGETPLWRDTRVTGLFEADVDTRQIEDHLGNILNDHWQWQIVEDKDWEREWMQHYHPIQCNDNLWVCPSWIAPPDPTATNILLDPGLAFGTGTHPTTFLCLKWLAEQDLKSLSVIDYGCGSGILGIAALLLGAQHAVGIDIDPQALIASRDNAVRNGLNPESFPVFMPQAKPSAQVDVIIANILAGPLVDLAPQILTLLKPGGLLCLSGILATQAQDVIAAYAKEINFSAPEQKDEWVCIYGKKKDTK